MMTFLFWGAVGLLVYTYLLFPALCLLRGRWLRRPFRTAPVTPTVSVIIAAHNEAGHIAARLENLLTLDYPRRLLEIIVASDGSGDGTDDMVRAYGPYGIKLLSLPRRGKIAALNAGVAAATGEVLVFTDANSHYAWNALRELVRPLADPQVGGVAGDQHYLKGGRAGSTGEAERGYWNLERRLKLAQSQAGHVTSATGAIYAVRRSLFVPIPPGVTDDFVASTAVIAQGRRLVFAPDAIAHEPAAKSNAVEFGRKVRVITQGLRAVWVMRTLLNPARHGFYALQLFTHKVLRRLMVFPLLVVFIGAGLLWDQGSLYRWLAVGQALFYGCAVLGGLAHGTRLGRSKLLAMPFYFGLVYAASLVAVFNLLRGKRIGLWEPQRGRSSEQTAL